MLQTNIGAYVKNAKGINPANQAAGTINGPAIDRTGYNSCVLHHACGAATGAPSARTVDAKLQHSDASGSGFTDFVPGAAGSGAAAQLVADNTEAEKDIDLTTAKQYIRVVEVVAFTAGTSPAIPVAATVTLGGKDTLPA